MLATKYSQNDEEKFIVDYFSGKPKGRFIDIGAFDVFKFSNTRRLYELGWKGVFVEPSPPNYRGIAQHYKDDPEITVLNIAIGADNSEIDFYQCEDAVSTSDPEHMKKWNEAGVKYNLMKIKQVSIADFMAEHLKGVTFLNIDTEATNMNIFRAMPEPVWYQIKMLCIEHDNYQGEVEQKLGQYGFAAVYSNAENIILAKQGMLSI